MTNTEGTATSRKHLLWLGAILLLALALRLAWIAYAHPNPNDGRFDDTLFYDHAAQSLAAGKGYLGFFDAQTAGWPPGYPLLLAGIYKAFGHGFLLPRLLNVSRGRRDLPAHLRGRRARLRPADRPRRRVPARRSFRATSSARRC